MHNSVDKFAFTDGFEMVKDEELQDVNGGTDWVLYFSVVLAIGIVNGFNSN